MFGNERRTEGDERTEAMRGAGWGGVNSLWLAGVRNEVHHVGQQLAPAQTEVSRSTK